MTIGLNSLDFQSVALGFIQVLPNTIITAVTIIAGVTSVNNPEGAYQVGSNQETDANFRLRRQASTATPAQGEVDGLYGGLNNLSSVNNANVYENDTNGVVNGIPAHGIWVVTNGGGDQEIADLIYKYRAMGVPMKGSQSYVITQANGTMVTMYWDEVVFQDLHVVAYLQSLNGTGINLDAIKNGLVANWQFKINESATIAQLNDQIRRIDPNVICSGLGVSSDGITYVNVLAPSSQQNQFVLEFANIILNIYP